MKKIIFVFAAVCCVAMMGVMLSSCDHGNNPSVSDPLKALDPYLVWGANSADVQKHIEAKTGWKNGNDSLEYWAGEGWHKWYWVTDSLTEQYLFETQDGQNLRTVQCYSYDKSITFEAAQAYLKKRDYVFLTTRKMQDVGDATAEIYASADKKTRVYLIPTSGGYWFMSFEKMPTAEQ